MTLSRPRLAAVVAMLGLVVTTTPTIAQAAPDRADRTTSVLEAAPAPAHVKGTLPSNAIRSRFVEIGDAGLSGLAADSAVSFEVFPGEVLTGTVEGVSRDAAATSWNGTLDDGGAWFASRVDGTFHVSLQTSDGGFEVSNAGGDTYRVVETETRTFRGTDESRPPADWDEKAGADSDATSQREARAARPSTGSDEPTSAAGDAGNVVDILFVITAAARAEAGTDAAVAAQVATGISQMNTAMQRSGVPGQVRQAGIIYTPTTEFGGDLTTDLRRVTAAGDGYYDEVQASREAVHADLVSLWIGGTDARICGRGWLAPSEKWGFHTLFRSCATDPGTFTFAHEAGHNFKLSHDANASEAPSSDSPVYARGYVDLPAKVYTIMAYPSQCIAASTYCTKLLNYSNPAVLENGRPTGTDLANNARAMAEQFAAVANYRLERLYGSAPAITGTPRFKGKLIAQPGLWEPSNVALGYQWFADGAPMAGRTSPTIPVTKWMIGRSISVQVTAAADYYPSVVLGSLATAPIGKALFRKRRAVLKGKARVGRVLKVKTKIRPKAKKVSYRWYRGHKRIKGAKKATYRLRRADRGKKVYVKIKAKKKGYVTLVKRTQKRKVRR